MDSPTSPGDPVVLPNAHSALINNKLDEFLNSFTRVNNSLNQKNVSIGPKKAQRALKTEQS